MIMLVHHMATILLITFSYTNNMIRAGTLVMCLHDASDIFLEVNINPEFNLLSPGVKSTVKGCQFDSANVLLCKMDEEHALP